MLLNVSLCCFLWQTAFQQARERIAVVREELCVAEHGASSLPVPDSVPRGLALFGRAGGLPCALRRLGDGVPHVALADSWTAQCLASHSAFLHHRQLQ